MPFDAVLIVGCGYLGGRVADALVSAGRTVFALTRNRADALAARGIRPITGDVTDAGSLQRLPEVAANVGWVVYAVGMDRTAGKSMREVYAGGLRNVLAALPGSPRFTYVSSTGVYGQTSGEWVTEASETNPTEESGKIVLEAEGALRETRPDATVLRFAGIYGPGRLLRRQPLLNGEPFVGDADKWLNLIHVADGVRAVLATEAVMLNSLDPFPSAGLPSPPPGLRTSFAAPTSPTRGEVSAGYFQSQVPQGNSPHLPPGGGGRRTEPEATEAGGGGHGNQAAGPGLAGRTFNISDGTPVTRRDFYTRLAELLGAPPAKFEPSPTPATEPNRRIDSRAAREALGFVPEFPSYREGLAASLG